MSNKKGIPIVSLNSIKSIRSQKLWNIILERGFDLKIIHIPRLFIMQIIESSFTVQLALNLLCGHMFGVCDNRYDIVYIKKLVLRIKVEGISQLKIVEKYELSQSDEMIVHLPNLSDE